MPTSRFQDRSWPWFLVACTPIISLFFLIPLELYYGQRIFWEERIGLPLVFVALGLLLTAVVALPFFKAIQRSPSTTKNISVFLFCVGTFVLLADLYAPIKTTPLNGWEITSSEPVRYTVIETLIFLVLFSVWRYLGTLRVFSFAFPCAAFFLATSLGYFTLTLVTPSQHASRPKVATPNPELVNVYHFLLDELQTDSALIALRDNDWFKKLDGFTIFPYNRSNYLYTRASFPSYMTGATLEPGSNFQEWLLSHKERGILKDLAQSGYELSMYAPWRNWENDLVSTYQTIGNMRNARAANSLPQLSDFLPLWFARSVPNILTNEALHFGKKIEKLLRPILGGDKRTPRTINEGRDPYNSVVTYKELLAEEKDKAAFGRYTYIHGIIPHGPYVIDQNCQFTRALPQRNTLSYYYQTICALRLVTDFMDELKRLNRYDSSVIIVHADTGHGLRGFVSSQGKKILSSRVKKEDVALDSSSHEDLSINGWSQDQVRARTMAFLMVKPPKAMGKVVLSEQASQLIDLYPTVLSLVGKPVSSTKGDALFTDPPASPDREYRFYQYNYALEDPMIETETWTYNELVETLAPTIAQTRAALP